MSNKNINKEDLIEEPQASISNSENDDKDVKRLTIIDFAPLLIKSQIKEPPGFIEEMSIWYSLKEQSLIESKDIKEFDNVIKKTVKLSLLSLILATVINRRITKAKMFGTRFIDYNILIKIPARLLICATIINYALIEPISRSFYKLYKDMNSKYLPRYKLYNETGEPLIMNQLYFSDPSFSADEVAIKKSMYEKIKQQQLMVITESKEIEKNIIANEKLKGNRS